MSQHELRFESDEDLGMSISITLTVLPESQEQAAQVVEVLSRSAAGLAFDGQSVSLMLTNYDEDETL